MCNEVHTSLLSALFGIYPLINQSIHKDTYFKGINRIYCCIAAFCMNNLISFAFVFYLPPLVYFFVNISETCPGNPVLTLIFNVRD